MYIATQVLGGDLQDFFCHETLPYPPALSKSSQIRSENKSNLAKCIKPTDTITTTTKVTGAVLEGSVIVNMTKPKKNQNLNSYCAKSFYPQVEKLQKQYKTECNVNVPSFRSEQDRVICVSIERNVIVCADDETVLICSYATIALLIMAR